MWYPTNPSLFAFFVLYRVRECRDLNDDKFLEVALRADTIITGALDLLRLGTYGDIPIMAVRSFLDQSAN